MITAQAITVRFGKHVVVQGQDVTAMPGQIRGIAGRSGTGKTTVLRVLAGQHKPDQGTVQFDGKPTARPGSIALLAQHPRLVCNPRWTLARIITEPADIAGHPADAGHYAAQAKLPSSLLSRFPGQVSDGQLQRACLARVLVQRPDYLLCDEPTAMLDPMATADVVALLLSLVATGVGIVMASHDPDVVGELCTTVTELTPHP